MMKFLLSTSSWKYGGYLLEEGTCEALGDGWSRRLSRQISRLQKPSRTSIQTFEDFLYKFSYTVVWKPALVTDICHLLQPDDSCAPPLQPLQRGYAAAHLISRKLEIGENVICVEAAAVLILDAYSSYLRWHARKPLFRNMHVPGEGQLA